MTSETVKYAYTRHHVSREWCLTGTFYPSVLIFYCLLRHQTFVLSYYENKKNKGFTENV